MTTDAISESIVVNELSAGIYFVQFTSGNRIKTLKLMKK
ncbi:T9SS type A sorting domain-containing protein [uncultured Aquimarina sp.]